MLFTAVRLFRLLPVLCISLQFANVLAIANSIYQTAFVGTNVTISCNHPGPFYSADWVRPRSGNDPEKELCLNGICLSAYSKRFSVDRSNKFKLAIRNVTANDSGKYVCIAYDDQRDHRYITELSVTDRPLVSDIVHSTTADFSITTETRSQLKDTSIVVAISLAIVVSVCATVSVFIIVAIVLRRRKQNTDRNDQMPYSRGKSNSLVELMELNPRNKDDEYNLQSLSNVVEHFAVSRDARLLAISFLILFRKKCNSGSNKSVSAANTFRLLAKSSPLWLSKLVGKDAAKQRIRRVLYYECSGYISPPVGLDPIKQASTNNPVMAVTVLNGCVYIISKDSATIIVVPDREERISVNGIKCPVDIVACAETLSLYIADEQRCIWRVSADGGKAEKWRESGKLIPKAMSIYNGSVLLTTDTIVLLKFSADEGGKVINLPINMEPHHAAETARNTYVVCCKFGRGEQVAEVGSDGRVIRKFASSQLLLRNPSYVVLDGDGRPLVADSVNSKILLLDLKLKYSHTILSRERDGIAAPHRLCLDESTGHLYVVRRQGHHVEAFTVKAPSRLKTF